MITRLAIAAIAVLAVGLSAGPLVAAAVNDTANAEVVGAIEEAPPTSMPFEVPVTKDPVDVAAAADPAIELAAALPAGKELPYLSALLVQVDCETGAELARQDGSMIFVTAGHEFCFLPSAFQRGDQGTDVYQGATRSHKLVLVGDFRLLADPAPIAILDGAGEPAGLAFQHGHALRLTATPGVGRGSPFVVAYQIETTISTVVGGIAQPNSEAFVNLAFQVVVGG